MKQILLKDIFFFEILRINEDVYLYESPNHAVGSFRVDRLLAYFSDAIRKATGSITSGILYGCYIKVIWGLYNK